jgi:hypothetical protein
MSGWTVLVQDKDGAEWVFPSTFGHYNERFLWNKAWCLEHYDRKTIGSEGRSWFGIVNEIGIKQLKDLGYSIQPARVVVDDRGES